MQPQGSTAKLTYDPETFGDLFLTEQLDLITEEHLAEVELNEKSQKVPSHHCNMHRHDEDTHPGWNCDWIKGANRCLSGLTGFY